MHEAKNAFYEKLLKWFDNYVDEYDNKDEYIQLSMDLKRNHTKRVVEVNEEICKREGLDKKTTTLGNIIALLHDIGRFEQFTKYKTFNDHESLDHGALGVQIIKEEKIIEELPQEEQEIILSAVLHHNKKKLPKKLSEQEKLFCTLIRDADKIDIMHLIIKGIEGKENHLKKLLAKLTNEGYNEKITTILQEEEKVDKKEVKSITDYILFIAAWTYDINYQTTKKIIKEKKYLQKLFKQIPASEQEKTKALQEKLIKAN